MPIDKQSKGSTGKPITPALSSHFRNGKTSIAPRLAASTPTSPAVAARKDLREQTLSPQTEQDHSPLLNGNITPRSGPRNTRISANSPASPALRRRLSATSTITETLSSARRSPGVGVPGSTDQSRSVVKGNSPNISAARRTSGSSTLSKKEDEPAKFFRANDARPPLHSAKSTTSPRQLPASYLKVTSPRAVNSAPPSAIDVKGGDKEESFVRANEAYSRGVKPLLKRKPSTTSVTSMTSMNTARTRSPELSRTKSQPSFHINAQVSPKRPGIGAVNKPISPPKPNVPQSPSAALKLNNAFERRRSLSNSAETNRPAPSLGHKKSSSISSLGAFAPKFMAPPPLITAQVAEPTWSPPLISLPHHSKSGSIPSPDTLSPRSASLTSSKTVETSVTSDTDASDISKMMLPASIVSPTDVASSFNTHQQTAPLPQIQVDAANARRERKVLDLEISNSSLLAINKTLEKELRKQSMELRRFRRLSRSGRLSLAPSNRSVSGQSVVSLDTLQEQTEDDDEDSDDDDYEESDLDDPSDDSDGHATASDPLADTTARARRRARDERRLMLDLSKHQQILIDSQKLNQNIRKCLSLTETLIKDGKKALDYKVGIGDIKLGGRVLSADDYDHATGVEDFPKAELKPRQGLLSPSAATAELREQSLWASSERLMSTENSTDSIVDVTDEDHVLQSLDTATEA